MNRAASFVEECGADIIDINMGCPAKKICKTDCGSALMKNLPLADEIIRGSLRNGFRPCDPQDADRLGQ